MGGSGKKKKDEEQKRKEMANRRDGGGGDKRDPGKSHMRGGQDGPTARNNSPPHTSAKRGRSLSRRRPGKFVLTFKEVEDTQTTSDNTPAHTKRVTRSQTVSDSTTSSPVKGDPKSTSAPRKTATVSEHSSGGSVEEELALMEANHAAIEHADRLIDKLYLEEQALKQSTKQGDKVVVPGVWTEKALLTPSGQPLTANGLKQFTESTGSVTDGSTSQSVAENNSNLDRSIRTPPEESLEDNDLVLQSEAGSSPALSDGELPSASDDEVEVMEVTEPKSPPGTKPAQKQASGRTPSQTTSVQPQDSYEHGSKRAPAPQRGRGGPGQQRNQPPPAHNELPPVPRMSQKVAQEKYDQHCFIIDTHMHVMEYTGRYFRNAKSYRQWSRVFKDADVPFAFGVEILHDPSMWSVSDANTLRGPISYVRQGYTQIIPPGKYPVCAVACHPKFSAVKYDQTFYGAERIKAALAKLIQQSYSDFNGMEVIAIGEFGLEFGVSVEEKNKTFPREVSDAQKKLFMAHVDVAKDTGLPIILHIRGRNFRMQQELERLAIRYLQEADLSQDATIIRHSYTGGSEVAQEWVDAFNKTYFSYGPVSRSWKQSAECMDSFDPYLNRSLVETDCPLQERDEPENARLTPFSPHRVPSHPDTALKMLKDLCDARPGYTLEDAAQRVAAATLTAFGITDAGTVMAALMCEVEPGPNSIATADHEVACPGHLYRHSKSGYGLNAQMTSAATQSGQPPNTRKQKLQASLVKAAIAGAGSGNASTRPSTNVHSDDGRDFGDSPQNQAAAATSKRKRSESKPRKGAAAAAPTADEDQSEFPFLVKALPTRPTKLEQDEVIPLDECRRELLIDATDKTATGLELFKECKRIHKGECVAQKVGGQVRSLNPDKIAKIKSQKSRDLAERVARKDIPSIFHAILIHYLKHIPEERGPAKYRAMLNLLDKDVDELLDEVEFIMSDLIQNDIYDPHMMSDQHIFQGVHSWTFCCRYPYNCCQHRKTVGPISYTQTPRRELSQFGSDLLDFILCHLLEGIDHNRMFRQGDRSLLISQRVVFIGDSVAASLAGRSRTTLSNYVEDYTLKELAKFLNTAYFGWDVQQVIIAVGRHDLPRYTFNGNTSEHTFYVEHVLITLARNFPHVRFTFVHPPYTHTQRKQWEQHVLETSLDASEVLPGDIQQQRCVQVLPRMYRSLYDRSSNDFDDNQDWMDADGNLRWGGLVNLVRHLQTVLKVEVFELSTQIEGSPLNPRHWKTQDFTRGPPAGQQNAPYGKSCLLYLSEEELPATKFDMRPPVGSDETRSQTSTAPSTHTVSERQSTSQVEERGRSPQKRDDRLSYPRVSSPRAHSQRQLAPVGTQYQTPQYQLVSDTQRAPANPPVSQRQPTQTQTAGLQTAQATAYIPSPLHLYGTRISQDSQPYYHSPMRLPQGVSHSQQQPQAPQPVQQTVLASYAPPPPSQIPPPPPMGFGTLFQPSLPVSHGPSQTAPQMTSGNTGQPMASQAQPGTQPGFVPGYPSYQMDQSQYAHYPAQQFQPYGVGNIPMPSHIQPQSQTPGSEGYHSMPQTAPPSVSQTPAMAYQQPPSTSTAAPLVGQNVMLTPEMVEALVKAGLIPPRHSNFVDRSCALVGPVEPTGEGPLTLGGPVEPTGEQEL